MNDINDAIWDAYNLLLLGPDIERLRKLLVRYDLFRISLDVPGDIVECGVFKGTGLMLWLKLLQIYCPGSIKQVIGFDVFTSYAKTSGSFEAEQVESFISESRFQGVTIDEIYEKIKAINLSRDKCELVSGDIRKTASEYVATHPGFRISLLNLDLDLEEATFTALEALWPRVVRGGVVIFDEYSVSRWTESDAVDKFFNGKSIKLRTLGWARTPTSYVVKE